MKCRHMQYDLGLTFGISKMHLSAPVAYATVRSKARVLLLLIHCLYQLISLSFM